MSASWKNAECFAIMMMTCAGLGESLRISLLCYVLLKGNGKDAGGYVAVVNSVVCSPTLLPLR